MKRLLLLSIYFLLLAACGSKKQIEKALYTGNYDNAITNALKVLVTNKDHKRKQKFIVMLEDAYHKAVARDLKTINDLKMGDNPEYYKNIFELYVNLDQRQEALKPVLPLTIGKQVIMFEMNDYTNDIASYRQNVSNYKYGIATNLLNSNTKYDAKTAYDILYYIEQINPNYKDVRQLMQVAHRKGIDHILVSIHNETRQIIPKRLENELLDFKTYGLNNFWTVYHSKDDGVSNYDYNMQLQLKQINISPEHIREREILREREVVDGWEYQLDGNGNVMKDSTGKDIKIDKIIVVKSRLFEFTQTKSTQIIADVVYTDLVNNQIINQFSIDSEFLFENVFARMRGDKRALNKRDRKLLRERRLPFPSNEQMVFDTGEDLKFKLKDILNDFKVTD